MKKFSITKSLMMSLLISAGSLLAAPTGGSTCENLSRLSLPHVTITSAESVAAGAFLPPAAPGPFRMNTALFKGLPAFCRVQATLTPSSDSDIKIEVWLPSSGWNNDLQSIGNGGWNGTMGYAPLAEAREAADLPLRAPTPAMQAAAPASRSGTRKSSLISPIAPSMT